MSELERRIREGRWDAVGTDGMPYVLVPAWQALEVVRRRRGPWHRLLIWWGRRVARRSSPGAF